MGDHCWNLKNDVEIEEFKCNHMEEDTILLYIYSQHVMVLVAYVAHQIVGTLYTKSKRAIYDCKTLCRAEVADVFVPFYIHTGTDVVCNFYGHGKQSIFDSKSPKKLGSCSKELGKDSK